MSLTRVLGMMLASRMAGRGARRGLGGGALGGLAAAGMLGGRRGGLGRKAGIAALGYMAYRAYRDRQGDTDSSGGGSDAIGAADRGEQGRRAEASGSGEGLGGMLRSIGSAMGISNDERPARDVAGTPSGGREVSDASFSLEHQRAAENFNEETALLLIRGMVAAANADGVISTEERARIMAQTDQSGATAEDERILERELANPRPLDELLEQVRDQGISQEFYLASRLAVDTENDASRAYLVQLRERLGLEKQEAAEIDSLAG